MFKIKIFFFTILRPDKKKLVPAKTISKYRKYWKFISNIVVILH